MSSEAKKALEQAREAIRIVAQKPLTKIEQYRLTADNARLTRQLGTERACRLANEAELQLADERLGALSRIILRTLACGQLEKLEDARQYLTKVTLTGTVEECPDGDWLLVRVDGGNGPSRGLLPIKRDRVAVVAEPQGAPACECKGTLTTVNADGAFELCQVCVPAKGAPQKPEGE